VPTSPEPTRIRRRVAEWFVVIVVIVVIVVGGWRVVRVSGSVQSTAEDSAGASRSVADGEKLTRWNRSSCTSSPRLTA